MKKTLPNNQAIEKADALRNLLAGKNQNQAEPKPKERQPSKQANLFAFMGKK